MKWISNDLLLNECAQSRWLLNKFESYLGQLMILLHTTIDTKDHFALLQELLRVAKLGNWLILNRRCCRFYGVID